MCRDGFGKSPVLPRPASETAPGRRGGRQRCTRRNRNLRNALRFPGIAPATWRPRRRRRTGSLCSPRRCYAAMFGVWQIGNTAPMSATDKIKNTIEDAAGKAKEAVGKATGDDSTKNEGKADQAKSDLKDAGEKVKDAFKH